jgi:hypothetical protein
MSAITDSLKKKLAKAGPKATQERLNKGLCTDLEISLLKSDFTKWNLNFNKPDEEEEPQLEADISVTPMPVEESDEEGEEDDIFDVMIRELSSEEESESEEEFDDQEEEEFTDDEEEESDEEFEGEGVSEETEASGEEVSVKKKVPAKKAKKKKKKPQSKKASNKILPIGHVPKRRQPPVDKVVYDKTGKPPLLKGEKSQFVKDQINAGVRSHTDIAKMINEKWGVKLYYSEFDRCRKQIDNKPAKERKTESHSKGDSEGEE